MTLVNVFNGKDSERDVVPDVHPQSVSIDVKCKYYMSGTPESTPLLL